MHLQLLTEAEHIQFCSVTLSNSENSFAVEGKRPNLGRASLVLNVNRVTQLMKENPDSPCRS